VQPSLTPFSSKEVTPSPINRSRETWGSSRAYDASAAGLSKIGIETPFNLVVETVGGSAETLACGAAAVRRGGRICVLGLFFGPPPLEPFTLLT
jgi:threonine dehydrogenase-like Zn-dependent dehydrogenase